MKPTLLIPVENQVRELDPKLLLACIASTRGFSSIIGSRREIEMSIDALPRGIYLSKSMTIRSLLFFRIAHRFGHEIVTWDEEALVHLPPETYFSRRLDANAIKYVSNLFAWGPDNEKLWRKYPHLAATTPIHALGNPRSDLLRPELRSFYAEESEKLRQKYGNFVLINTNFNHVNAFGPDLNLFHPTKQAGEIPKFGRAARGMSREYAEGLRDHKLAIFAEFKKLIPRLESAFPDFKIVVRPHPTEKHDVYQQIAARCPRVAVTNEGNVVPWLMACRALLHNGCTTGVEAYVLGVPAISFRAVINETYDNGFYRLPNLISHQCFSFEELQRTLQKILDGQLGAANGDERNALIKQYLSAQKGTLSCERIVEILTHMSDEMGLSSALSLKQRFQRWGLAKGLRLARWIQPKLPGSHNRPEFQRLRFPEIKPEDLRERIARFQRILGRERMPHLEKLSDKVFRINTVIDTD